MLKGGVKGMKIGVVTEGFAQPNAEADVNAKVKAAAKTFEKLGATVGEVSIPMHLVGRRIVDADRRRGPDPDHDVG